MFVWDFPNQSPFQNVFVTSLLFFFWQRELKKYQLLQKIKKGLVKTIIGSNKNACEGIKVVSKDVCFI